ncbi:glycosyltransferase family 4 protein [Vibrio sp. JC009]|uniref:glycosyltransferase family 4 protein n=1 Tax=Vibrio sp. JC009 TaxID=2912314 RepID=UPI0023B1DAEB|nr:glycosyltransferase family 1 protein [Vibrio sp. JC009]WED21999.1 glycosyltransferase family 4 protein [Vibrio sp. JC009]
MKIVIDLQSLQSSSKNRGIGHYTKSLLTQISSDWSDHEVILLLNRFDKKNIEDLCFEHEDFFTQFKVVFFEGLNGSVESSQEYLTRVKLSEELRHTAIEALNPDVVLITSLIEGGSEEFACSIPKVRNYKVGVIGYDLIPLINPDMHLVIPNVKQWYMRKVNQFHNADIIFAISDSARSEFIEYLNISPNSVVNISSACSQDYFEDVEESERKRCLEKIGINSHYILYSGACDERKNLFRLIEAYSKLDESIIENNKLALVGRYSEVDKKLLSKYVKKCGLSSGNIIYTGYISNRELNVLYSKCSLFVFPSLHEGFGLPVLEAMTCGAPVICSNTSSLPEVIGIESAMFDPENVKEIRDLMQLVLTNSDKKKELLENAEVRKLLFSWKITTNRILEHFLDMKVGYSSDSLVSDAEKHMIEKLTEKCDELNASDTLMREVACSISANSQYIKNNYL